MVRAESSMEIYSLSLYVVKTLAARLISGPYIFRGNQSLNPRQQPIIVPRPISTALDQTDSRFNFLRATFDRSVRVRTPVKIMFSPFAIATPSPSRITRCNGKKSKTTDTYSVNYHYGSVLGALYGNAAPRNSPHAIRLFLNRGIIIIQL